jgi:hypothetical protein
MFTSVFLMGGLGNQLFQLFTLLAYAKRYNKTPLIKYSDTLQIGITRPTYWNTFLANFKKYTTTNEIRLPMLREHSFRYSEIPNIKQPFQLHGYFQSYKYFNDKYKELYQEIGIDKMRLELLHKHSEYFIKDKINVSMHFRIGDYKHQQHNHPVMPSKYYINSIKNIIDKTNSDNLNVLYFCERNDINDVNVTIKELNVTFPNITFIKADDEIEDWKQMLLMSNCQHHIIANSTFSWWGAYFNSNKDKIICYPSKWFGPAMKNDVSDLFPENWNKIDI